MKTQLSQLIDSPHIVPHTFCTTTALTPLRLDTARTSDRSTCLIFVKLHKHAEARGNKKQKTKEKGTNTHIELVFQHTSYKILYSKIPQTKKILGTKLLADW